MFTQDDLALNRNGQLAPSQAKQVESIPARRFLLNATVFGLLAMFFIGLGIFLSFLPPRSPGNSALVPLMIMGGIGSIMFVVLGKYVWDWWRVKQDLSEGRVMQGLGEVEWKGNRYRATVEGRSLQFVASALAPSRYQFYYLPRTGYILSAESLGHTDPNQSLQSVLNTVFRFDPNDLALNRQGQLGESQLSHLQRQMWAYAIIGLVMVSVFTSVPLFVMFVASNQSSAWIPTLLFLGVDVIVAIVFTFLAWRVWRDISDRRVEILNGVLRKYVVRGNKSSTYYIEIGNKKFAMGIPQYNVVIEGRTYRLYYAPRSSIVIGIEVDDV
ncbi:MAG: hypothetical protein HY740_05275 [Chloroflexi bacterium]|nr:hypothetical protein [Chloroflexota bacterium]